MSTPLTVATVVDRLRPGQRIEFERLPSGRIELTISGPFFARVNATKIMPRVDGSPEECVAEGVDLAFRSVAEMVQGASPEELAAGAAFAAESDRRLEVAMREVSESMRRDPTPPV